MPRLQITARTDTHRGRTSAALVVLALPLLLILSGASSEPWRQTKVLRTFAAEFVPITPGTGKFPAPSNPLEDFAICRYETTQDLYTRVMGQNPSRWKGERNSVESMTHYEAVAFCRRVTEMLRQETLIGADEVIRLPTESEWEYCCRAGTKTRYSFGDTATQPGDQGAQARRLDAYAWHHGNAAGNDPAVGVLKPNPWGLYDMHGYLWEYVADEWRPADKKALPPPLPGASHRTMRGGSWRDHYSQLQSDTRWPVADHVRSDAIGFRCVRSKVR